MPYIQPSTPGSSQLPPLPASNGVQKPNTTQTQSSQTQTKPNTAPNQIPTQDQAKIPAQGTASTTVALVESPPPPPALLKKDQNSPENAELNKLLKNLGLLKATASKYDDKTAAAVSTFQKNNGLQVTGEVDAETLRKLLDATKEDEATYPRLEALIKTESSDSQPELPDTVDVTPTPKPSEVKTYANDFERVQDLVATQLSAKGADPAKAFEVGGKLKDAARKWDKKMPSETMCYTAVKRAIDDSLKIPYQVFAGKRYPAGKSAKTAGKYLLSKQPEFVKVDGLKRSDLDNLPAGAVIVYKPAKGHGHIGVQDGAGHDISDKTRIQSNVHKHADFEVYYPVAVRGEK